MKPSAIFGAVAAAAALCVAAPAAAAITLTFQVTLNGSSLVTRGDAAGFAPAALTFEETWTLSPTLSSTPSGAYSPPGSLTYNYRDNAAVGEGTDPLSDARDVAGLDDGLDYSRATFKNRRVFDASGNRIFMASEFELDQGRFVYTPAADSSTYQNANRYIFGAQGNYLASSLYDNAMIEFLTGRTLSYRVTGAHTVYDTDFNLLDDNYYEITGTAVLLSYSGTQDDPAGPNGRETYGAPAPVPEPATWALMIGGFGLAGRALRRKTARV